MNETLNLMLRSQGQVELQNLINTGEVKQINNTVYLRIVSKT
jgi:hypothetical protein